VGIVTLDRAELGDEILLAADAFARNPGIEEVGTEPHLNRNLRLERNGFLEETLSDVAPGAYHVGYDIDRQGCGIGHETTSRAGEELTACVSSPQPLGNLWIGSNPRHQRGEIVGRLEGCERDGRLERLVAR